MREQVNYQLEDLTTFNRGIRIERQLNEIKGIKAFVNIASGSATVRYDTRWVTEPEIRQIIRTAGGKFLPDNRDELLFSPRERCSFELCDLAARENVSTKRILGYAYSLLYKESLDFVGILAKAAQENGIGRMKVKHLRKTRFGVSGVIEKKQIRCGTGIWIHEIEKQSPDEGPRLYLSENGEIIGFFEFTVTRLRE